MIYFPPRLSPLILTLTEELSEVTSSTKKMASQIVTLLFLFGIISIWAAEWTHEGNGRLYKMGEAGGGPGEGEGCLTGLEGIRLGSGYSMEGQNII